MPRINASLNIQKEKERFCQFLYDGDYKDRWIQMEENIYEVYEDLKKNLEGVDNLIGAEPIISSFLDKKYKELENGIEEELKKIEILVKGSERQIFEALSKTMDYDFPDEIIGVHPSIMPGSTYGRKGLVFLSIINKKPEGREYEYRGIAIHELTHVVWDRRIKDVYDSIGFKYDPKLHNPSQAHSPVRGTEQKYIINKAAHEDLKEIFAPVIIRCPEFDILRQVERLKKANPPQQLLNVEYKGEEHEIVDFFETIYNAEKEKGTHFADIMAISLRIIYTIQNELVSIKKVFDKIKYDYKNEEESIKRLEQAGYRKPIKIPPVEHVNPDQYFK